MTRWHLLIPDAGPTGIASGPEYDPRLIEHPLSRRSTRLAV